MPKAVFLDRDGLINRKREGYVTKWEELEILPGVIEAIGLLKFFGYKVIVITNQRCVAKGLISEAELFELHHKLLDELPGLDAVYACPHDDGCECRKPKPGLLLEAARIHNIDLSKSWMVGDSESDVQAGQAAGCRTIQTTSLLDAANRIAEEG